MKIALTFKHKLIICLIALLVTALFGAGGVFAESKAVSVKIRGDENTEKAFATLDEAWAYATGFDEETLSGTNIKIKSDSRRTNYAEMSLYDNCETTKTLTVPAGVTVKIYLNGKKIDHQGKQSTNAETDPGSVFVVNGERNAPGALFLDGGIFPDTSVVTGGNAADKGGGICVNEYGELTLHDVTITGNTAKNRGGGVFLTSDGTGHGKMTVGGKVTIAGNKQNGTFLNKVLNNKGTVDDLYIGGEDGTGMDVFGIENDSAYPMTIDSKIYISHLPREVVMRDDNREMMSCFKNEREGYVFRYKNIYNVNPEKSGNYIVMVPEPEILPQIRNVTFMTADEEDIEAVGQPTIDAANKTITITLDTDNDLKFLYAEISTTQEVMIRAKDGDPGLLPAGRQDYGMYAGSFAAADYSGDAGRTFILYGFDKDDKHPNETEEWTVKVQANKRKVTFDTMGGGALTDSFPDSIVVEKGKRFNDIQDPKGGLPKTAGTDFVAFPGRVLEGWYFDKTLQRRVTGEEVINNSMTLYAKWYVREFPINYFMTGTLNNQENPAYFNVNSGNLTIKNPQGYEYNTFNNGKLFIGWSYKDFHNRNVDIGNTLSPQIPSGSFINASTASLDYTPQYMTQQHNVVLDFGGAGEIENKNVMVDHGNTFIANNYIPQNQSLPTGVKWLKDLEDHALDCNNSSITEDTTLYAAYTLFLDANGGNYGSSSQRASGFFAINDNYTSFLTNENNIPSRAGNNNTRYVFDGWYTADTGGTKVSSGVMPSHEVTLYAHWLEVPVNTNNTNNTWETVRFDTGGVDMPAGAHGIALQQGSTAITASDFNFDAKPTRNGYIFDGWYAAEGYNADGNLINPSQHQIWDGNSNSQSLSLPECSGGHKDLTLYAKWEQSETQTHTVSFSVNHFVMEPDGKTFKNCNNGLKTYDLTLNPVMKVPTLTDNELKTAFGISDDATLNKVVVMPHNQYVRVDKDVQEVNYYYVRKSFPYYYQHNGTPTTFIDQSRSTKNGYYPFGSTIKITYTGTNNLLHGSAFNYWTTEIDGAVQNIESHSDNFGTPMPAGLLSLKPVTTPYSGTLDIKLDGGNLTNTADANANPAVKDNKITFTGKTGSFTMPTPKKEGYEFVGWRFTKRINNTDKTFTANPLIINTYEEIDNRTTYTAVWKKTDKTYSVDFDLNGHGAPQPKSVTGIKHGSKLTRDSVIIAKNVKATGYNNEDDEVDWYKDSACTDNQIFDVDNGTVTENMTLYAKWTPQEYNVTLDMNGGSIANGQKSPFKYTIEDNAITLINPTWPGKTFAGWTGTGLDKPTVNVTIPTGSTGNRTYKANWTTGLYTVNFDTQGKGKAPADQKVLGDDNHFVQRPVNPTEKGYSFEGWFTDKAGTVPYSFNYPLKASQLTNGTLTLYAKWKPILYQLNLDANGGKFKDGSKEKTERRYINDDISIIYTDNFTPTRENYLFMGWKTAKEKDKGEYFEDKTMSPQNITLYADWYEIPFVEITFDTQGGTVLPKQYVRSGQKITKPSDPIRTGYTLDGWYSDEQCTKPWDFTTNEAIDSMTLYAKWNVNAYTLTLMPNGGTFAGDTTENKEYTVSYGESLNGKLEDVYPPTGQKFLGWFANAQNEPRKQYTPEDTMPAGNLTLTAQYGDAPRYIYFDANGGTLQGDPLVKVIDGQPITAPTPTRAGYTFGGWYKDGETQPFDFNNISWTEGETLKTLRAKWTARSLTITLNANGGTFGGQTETQTATYDAFYDDTPISFGNGDSKASIYDAAKIPTREGHYFIGWYTTQSGDNGKYVDGSEPITDNVKYYARWIPRPGIVVMFETNGGSSVTPQILNGGEKVTQPTVPTKPGSKFNGWYQDKECSTEFNFNTPITDNTTIYAKWEPFYYHIDGFLQGGEVDISKQIEGVTKTKESSYTKYQYIYDTPTFSVDTPTKNGYTFAGWSWKPEGESKERKAKTYTVPQGSEVNQTINANWEIDQYSIKYDLNGGTLNTSNPTTYNVESDSITLKQPTREGYTFAGWTGTDLSNKTVDVIIPKGSTGDREYTANWTPIEYTITYHLNGGSVDSQNPTTYTIEGDTILLNNPTKPGYTFAGWQSSEFSGTMQKVIIPKGSTGDKTYTATWQPITYNISYDLDGGKLTDIDTNPTTYTVESSAITLHNPTKKGYTFTGWTGTDLTEASTSVTISQGSTGDREFKANWTPQKYTIILDPNGGTFADDTTANKTINDVAYNTILGGRLPMNLTQSGQHFCGWKDSEGNLYTPNVKMPALNADGGTLTLTAQWNANRIIYFDINSPDSPDQEQQIESESGQASKPETDPTRNHYTFNGWYADPDCTEAFDFNQTITAEFTVIYAGWLPKSYGITYNLNGGDLPKGLTNPGSFTIEDYFILNNPVKTGHTFDGWTGSNGNSAQQTVTVDCENILKDKPDSDETCNLIFTANWTVNSYQVTFNNMGKGEAPQTINNQAYNTTITKPNDPTQEGYTFDGWYKNEALTDKWDFTTDKMPDHNITLYAKWSANKVPVTVKHQRMNLNGGYDGFLDETEELSAYSDSLITPEPKTYEGFITPPARTVSVKPDGSTEVIYQYVREQYVLILNDEDNLVDYTTPVANPTEININSIIALMNLLTNTLNGSSNHQTTVTDLYYYGAPLQFNRVDDSQIFGGHKWYGWIMENNAGEWTKLSDAQNITMTMPAEDITIEPMIVDGEFNITYDLAGGTLPSGKTNLDKYKYGDSFTLKNPTRPGYIFTGWTGGGLSTPTKNVTITKDDFGDMHFTANWESIPTIYYRGHVQNIGWQSYNGKKWMADTDKSYIGTTGRALRLEAVQIAVPKGYAIKGFAHIQNLADTRVEKLKDSITFDGQVYDVYHFGTTGRSLRMEAIDFDILKDGKSISELCDGVTYRVHIQNGGWQGTVRGGSFAGTRGACLRMEALDFNIKR